MGHLRLTRPQACRVVPADVFIAIDVRTVDGRIEDAAGAPGPRTVAAWAQLDGTTGIDNVLDMLQHNPARLPAVMEHVVRAIGES